MSVDGIGLLWVGNIQISKSIPEDLASTQTNVLVNRDKRAVLCVFVTKVFIQSRCDASLASSLVDVP